ncbi:MAG: RHS repeat-associated core domain-containing protein [Pirellulales bacterium]
MLEEKVHGQYLGMGKTFTLGLNVIAEYMPWYNSGFLLYDGHGSTRVLLDYNGVVQRRFAYDAYGNLLGGAGLVNNIADAFTTHLYSGERTDPTGLQYLRARYYDPTTGRFNRLDPFAGDTQDPLSLHKYLYTHANPAMGVDPSGNSSLAVTIATAGIKAGLAGVAFGAPFRAYTAYREWAAGAQWRDIILGLMQGVATDFAVGAVLGGGAAGLVRQLGSNAFKLRAVGQSIADFTAARVPWSAWRIVDNSARGLAIEKSILNRAASFLGQRISGFPVIDDYIFRAGRGIATSVKSLDLTRKSYETAAGLRSQLNKYARHLQTFVGDTSRAVHVGPGTPNPIDDKVLVIAFEEGAATSAQASVLVEWLQSAATKFPDVKVVFQFVP